MEFTVDGAGGEVIDTPLRPTTVWRTLQSVQNY